jgi:hypothetical protein
MRALVTLLLVVCPLCQAAPIPPPKPKPRMELSGAWVAHWSGAEWPTVMLPCGTYVAERPGGPRYEGRWEVVGDKLKIEERLLGPEGYGQVYRYTFTMRPGALASTCGGLRLVSAR